MLIFQFPPTNKKFQPSKFQPSHIKYQLLETFAPRTQLHATRFIGHAFHKTDCEIHGARKIPKGDKLEVLFTLNTITKTVVFNDLK